MGAQKKNKNQTDFSHTDCQFVVAYMSMFMHPEARLSA